MNMSANTFIYDFDDAALFQGKFNWSQVAVLINTAFESHVVFTNGNALQIGSDAVGTKLTAAQIRALALDWINNGAGDEAPTVISMLGTAGREMYFRAKSVTNVQRAGAVTRFRLPTAPPALGGISSNVSLMDPLITVDRFIKTIGQFSGLVDTDWVYTW